MTTAQKIEYPFKWVLMRGIRLYQRLISPVLPPSCRFYPTCSNYALEALQTHGLVRALGLIVWRLLRCQPFCKGGYDPVPEPHRCSLISCSQKDY